MYLHINTKYKIYKNQIPNYDRILNYVKLCNII